MNADELSERIERYAGSPPGETPPKDAALAVDELLDALERGEVRAASCVGKDWRAVPWVKRGILLGFRIGTLAESGETLHFVKRLRVGGHRLGSCRIPADKRPEQ